MTTTTFNFNQKFFTDNFEKFQSDFDSNDAHPECFYIPFYDEFVADVIPQSEKDEWMSEWRKDFEDDDDFDTTVSFDEFINEWECFKEDVASDFIEKNDAVKQNAIAQMFFHISEAWSVESIEDTINKINN